MSFEEQLNKFLEFVEFEKTRIFPTQNPIFLCGGQIDNVQKASVSPGSLRSFLYNKIKASGPNPTYKLVTSEELGKWFWAALRENVKIPDLLEFEILMARLSAMTCLIQESPGAISELGSFCLYEDFGGRMLVVLNGLEYNNRSYIASGPIKRLKNVEQTINGTIILEYDWTINKAVVDNKIDYNLDPTELGEISDYIVTEFTNKLSQMNESELFKNTNKRHVYFLILEIISVFQCVKILEIYRLIASFGITIEKSELKICLFIAKNLGLITEVRYGGNDYFVALAKNRYADFTFKKNTKTNYEAVSYKIGTLESIENDGGYRNAALKKAKK